ncbi:PQQ-binding-like beta-propeller repeat protein [Streptomyces sp. NPDC057496]|uniref:outer membrane protein assembly factor BamB family protein n=1 Tax=Streptomyces sp. NPDC057496 TaxID=3346149 RepID=UPI0036A6FB01
MFDGLEPEDPRQVGRYRIVARIGAGGMGQVYLGRSPGGRPVALKVVRPELARDVDFRRRFAREVTAARRVNGAFTAGVVDAEPDGSPAWLATVYVSGVSLGEAVARHGPWRAEHVLALGAGLAEALEAIHAAGVVHRDLKPSNVLLAPDGPRVIDFGISTASEASALTHTGMTIGTPGFMSPEQLTGRSVGPASDVFALGAVLAHTATGTGPFGTGTPHALHFRAVYEEPDLDALPPELRRIVAACLAKEPDQRPTVADLLHRMTTPGEGDAAEAAPLLAEPGWMPDEVDRLVRAEAATPLPRTPVPTPAPAPAAAAAAAPTPTAPDIPVAPHGATTEPARIPVAPEPARIPVAPAAPAATSSSPATAPALHDAPTRTAGPAAQSPGAPTPPPLSRRGVLLAVTGTAATAGLAVALWKTADRGSGSAGSPSALQPSARKPTRTTAPPAPRKPGQKIWACYVGDEVKTKPTVANGVVYFGSNDRNLYALDAATGKERWSLDTGNVLYSTSVVVGDLVYVGTYDNGLYAVDAETGKKRWVFAAGGSECASPVVVDGVVYVGSGDEHFYAVDAVTGKKIWSFRCRKNGSVTEQPVVANGVVYFGSDDNHLYALDAGTGKRRWAFPMLDGVNSAPVVANGLVHISSSRLYAVNAATGKQRWSRTGIKYKMLAGHRSFSAPTVADGVVYAGDSIEYLFALDAATGKKRWAFETENSVFYAAAVADGVVYVGSEDSNLYAVDARTGKKRWAFDTGAGLGASPTVVGDVVYVGSKDRSLYAIRT